LFHSNQAFAFGPIDKNQKKATLLGKRKRAIMPLKKCSQNKKKV